MKSDKYQVIWLIFVNIKPKDDYKLIDLIDLSGISNFNNENFIGAWANIIIKADTINEALNILPLGLNELNFDVEFIEKIENVSSLIENKELKQDVRKEIDWLLNSDFVFKISDKIFPYLE